MLLLPKISGSSGFYKGPRTLRVLGPLQKLLLPLIFGSNISLLDRHFRKPFKRLLHVTKALKLEFNRYMILISCIFLLVQGQQQEPVILNRLQAQLYALATDPDTFLTEPHPDDADEFSAWKPELDKRQGEISELMVSNANIRKNYSALVPEKVINALSLHTYLSIWT